MRGDGDPKIILDTYGISKNFDGIDAIKDVSFSIREREQWVIIGPNGAGKTTLFNVLTGDTRMDSGTIRAFGRDVSTLPTRKRARMGMSRTYQISNLFPGMSVAEHLFAALHSNAGFGNPGLSFAFRNWRRSVDRMTAVESIAAEIGLSAKIDTKVSEISHGEQRQLELGIAVAQDAGLLLLDEPMAGLTAAERGTMREMIAGLSKTKTLIVIEHDIDYAFGSFEKLMVMDQGRILAGGHPDEIRNSPEVNRIYKLDSR